MLEPHTLVVAERGTNMPGFTRPDRPSNPSMVPNGSLQGTLTGTTVSPAPPPSPALPPSIAPTQVGGATVPADYASLINSPEMQPPQEPIPSGGHQALDAILGALGGFLGGQGLAALPLSILQTRQNVEEIKARNREAAKQTAKDRVDLILKGMEQSRADRVNEAQRKVDEAKRLGDVQEIKNAQQDLQNQKTTMSAQADRDAAELESAKVELERLRNKAEQEQNGPKLELLGNYSEALRRFRTQLQSQLASGAATPEIKHVDPDTGEVTSIKGIENIRDEFEAGLETALVNNRAAGADEMDQEAIRAAYESMIGGILDQWNERVTKNRLEAAHKSQAKAKQSAAAFQQEQNNPRGKRIAKKMVASVMPGGLYPFR